MPFCTVYRVVVLRLSTTEPDVQAADNIVTDDAIVADMHYLPVQAR